MYNSQFSTFYISEISCDSGKLYIQKLSGVKKGSSGKLLQLL